MSYSKTGQRYPDDEDMVLSPELLLLIALTALFLFLIDRISAKIYHCKPRPLSEILTTAYPVTLLMIIVVLLTMCIFSIPLDQFIPAYCVIFWITVGLLYIKEKTEKPYSPPNTPPTKKDTLPVRKDHDDTVFSVKR